jgi:DNA primase catalytic subunit
MEFQKSAKFYYLRKDVQNILLSHSKNREVVPKFMEGFGKRPDTLEYANDIKNLAEKGATSFHCSEELWRNPLDLKTELSAEEMSEMRTGWDLLIDIDSEYLDYSKIAAELVIEELKRHNVQNVGLKYSGNKGFHIIVPWEAFPKEISGIPTEKRFPELPRAIAQYINQNIRTKLIEEISSKTQSSVLKKYIKGEEKAGDFADKVMPDIVLVSPRHLFRMPYSLNEKAGLSSIVIFPSQLKNFHPGWAKPERVYVKNFIPEAEENEAKELVREALDWKKKFDLERNIHSYSGSKRELIVKDASPELYPPCIQHILNGLKQDGRKRALFILLNFFKSISLNNEEIRQRIDDWNKLNYKPLKSGYIIAQLSWFAKNKIMLPPNCDKSYYKDIAICNPDNFCRKINNPVKYVSEKQRMMNQNQNQGRKKIKKTK